MATAISSNRPDYSGAVDYALRRLCAELSPQLFCHNALYTEADVLPAVVRLGQLSNLVEPDLHLLRCRLNKHEDCPLLDLADTSSRIWIPVLPEMSD